MIILAIITLMAIFARCSARLNTTRSTGAISRKVRTGENGHILGTDGNGRDIFIRILYGARVSLAVGLLATAVSLVIGVTYGAVAGYFGGRIDNIMMRFVDVLYSLPFMFFVIMLMVVFGRNIFLIFVALGAWLNG